MKGNWKVEAPEFAKVNSPVFPVLVTCETEDGRVFMQQVFFTIPEVGSESISIPMKEVK